MLVLGLEGWAQCRLATDPDPSDEPRGVSGWTFAVAGEPDLDRVLRLQPPGAVPRRFGPTLGVVVNTVEVGGAHHADHALVGAAVNLLGNPVFDGRNGLAAEDTREPIMPFQLQVARNGVTLARRHADPVTGTWLATSPSFGRLPPELASGLGVVDEAARQAYRRRRAEQLRSAIQEATSETEEVALQARLDACLDADQPGARPLTERILGLAATYRVSLEGSGAVVSDEAGALGGTVGEGPWAVVLLIGAFDADLLCTFVQGAVSIPFTPR